MKKNKSCVLAVASFTKRVGFAVLNDTELIHFGVKTFTSPRTIESNAAQITVYLTRLIRRYRPDKIVVKEPGKLQMTSTIQTHLLQAVMKTVRESTTPVAVISYEYVKQLLASPSRPINRNAFNSLVGIYPELKRFETYRNRSQREYFASVLTAVAVGYISQR
jgi:RNase H-fold protein (predicted Holliday junction resolvase)